LFLLICDLAVNPTRGLPIDVEVFERFIHDVDVGIRFTLLCKAVSRLPHLKSVITAYSKEEYISVSEELTALAGYDNPVVGPSAVRQWLPVFWSEREYPATDLHGNGRGEDQDTVLVDEDFSGQHDGSLFLFHLLLPPRFVPCPERIPLDVPSEPSVIIRSGERLYATFIAMGSARLRFWRRRLSLNVRLNDYEVDRLFNKPVVRETKATWNSTWEL
jgi:hypothetical protein